MCFTPKKELNQINMYSPDIYYTVLVTCTVYNATLMLLCNGEKKVTWRRIRLASHHDILIDHFIWLLFKNNNIPELIKHFVDYND